MKIYMIKSNHRFYQNNSFFLKSYFKYLSIIFLIQGDDDVLHCLSDSAGHVTVARSYNQGTSNQPIANVRVTNVQGRVLCTLEVFMIYYLLIYHKLPFNLNNYDSGIKQYQFEFSTYLFLICIVKICKVITGTKC